MLDDRKLQILRAIVSDYVSMREPVGSRALVERYRLDVSPATVRNDMAVLEEEGYITQPHTSAGRIPTDKGYRLFVDRLGQVKPLSLAERRAIETFMAGAVDLEDVVQRTVRLLAQITRQVAIVQFPVAASARLRHIELVSLSEERGLVIVVNSTGTVEQAPISLEGVDAADAAELRGRLNQALVGLTVAELAGRCDALLEDLPERLRGLARVVVASVLELVLTEPTNRVMIAGVPNLAHFFDHYEMAMRPVLEALEEQVVLLRLLGETGAGGDITVRIGAENPYEPLRGTSMVASSYGLDPNPRASLGVVGPTRMDYPSTIAAVRAVARYVGRFLEG